MSKLLILSLIILFFSGCTSKPDFEFAFERKVEPNEEEIVETAVPLETTNTEITKDINLTEDKPSEQEEAKKEFDKKDGDPVTNLNQTTVDWPVPFAMQAPFSNWDMPYQEMCEEAALVLAYKYYSGEPLDKNIMDQELKRVRDWESKEWGIYTDSTAVEIKAMGEAVFNLEIEISEDVTIENIKGNLRKNNLVLVPTAGRELGNPFFKQPGPLYHILVLRGFTDDSFIANDVGIGKGEGYKYKYHTVINATHDLPVLADGTIFRPYDIDVSDDIKQAEMKNGIPRILIVKGIK